MEIEKDDTKELNLEECVYNEYVGTALFCGGCDGYNYNCVSYKPYLREIKSRVVVDYG